MKIVLLEPLAVGDEVLAEYRKKLEAEGHKFVKYDSRVEDKEKIIERAEGADAVIITNLPFPAEVINSLPELKYISVAFTGVDHVDLDACAENGVAVSNAPGYSTDSVAELALGMMINLSRKMNQCHSAVKAAETREGLIGNELKGKTLGIVGTGSIGLRVAEIAEVLGMNLLGYNRSEKEEAKKLGLKYTELEELFKKSDIISIHIPHTSETEGLIDKKLIDLMKESAYFINTARGPIIDSKALADALNEGRIAGAGIDVFEMEPPIPLEHPLQNAKNTLLTPHVAFATEEAFLNRAEIVFNNIDSWLKGNIINKVN
ncbi:MULTISPECIES: 2-hydroxyacid dehydrogenase [unclassified Halanaerobium]|uniref:2-hydroxyacid dehydrogenase n=1 Tax=unclassified Halanaerobium TaxID=2641197 RepID=UPI000DF1243A|nr:MULTISPECIES: 2-hydroxyacid dehydrogenase [unclassified Halanaerobium]RCW48689.1 D-3-phosphoglycerate dehydrogenase [Halanaerobium sp. MA284_MarDTE_T2]RCW86567.1 D-3-phosphoglycerate dehydrogenase [Halanaerobium sp. DL-01]